MVKLTFFKPLALSCLPALFAIMPAQHANAQPIMQENSPSYADLADLIDASQLVLTAEIRKQAVLEPERSPGLRAGYVRLYIEARTTSLLTGSVPIGESLRYLVDIPLDAKGKVPKLRKSEVVLFARSVPGNPGDLKLVAPSAQIQWTPELSAQLRPILTEFVKPDATPAISGIRDAFSIKGNLAGESETQIFLTTENNDPVSITVVHRPGRTPVWGVSWSEIVDQAARPPMVNTLDWYRLACFLPPQLPRSANMASDPQAQSRAATDYRFVIEQLGVCERKMNLMNIRL